MKTNGTRRKTAVVIGAGPAGLTAGLELLRHTNIHPVILEKSGQAGGLSRTVEYHGNRIDIGGHRFFSKDGNIMKWWTELLPIQGAPAMDDLLKPDRKTFPKGGPDPEKEDRAMLLRRRISHILYDRKFFDYPVSLSTDTLANLGLRRTLLAGYGWLCSTLRQRPENSLEDFYINRFGKPLYKMFFEGYTEKVWGLHPSQLDAGWGAQRVSGLSFSTLLKHILQRHARPADDIAQEGTEKSLIENFLYPKFGPGQLWEAASEAITQEKGNGEGNGEIIYHCTVNHIQLTEGKATAVSATFPDGSCQTFDCDYVFSSMPLKELIPAFGEEAVPATVREAAAALPYRDFITVGMLVQRIKITPPPGARTANGLVADTWIYIQERDVHIGRLQIFNNWSPYLVKDYGEKVWLGLEYFCNTGDGLWCLPDEDFIRMAVDELVRTGILESPSVVEDATVIREEKAYPAYHGGYSRLPEIVGWTDTIPNLFCIGRNGQHRYNNMDHSMLTAMEAVAHIREDRTDKAAIWNINTEQSYHESTEK